MDSSLKPLEPLAPLPGSGKWPVQPLEGLVGAVEPAERGRLASYLREGEVFFAWMEHTYDVIGTSFGVPGGSAILSDGRYYWRQDAAEYVETYGIAVPDEAVAWMSSQGWRHPVFSREVFLEIYDELERLLPARQVGGSTAPDPGPA